MRNAVYAFLEVIGAALEELAHLIDFLPVPLTLLVVFHELPHCLDPLLQKPVLIAAGPSVIASDMPMPNAVLES